MSFDFDFGSELVPDRIFEPAGDFMSGGEWLRTVDFEINRDRQAAGNRLDRNVMNGEAEIARADHDALAYCFVIKRGWLGRYGELGGRHVGSDRVGQLLLDGRD